MFNVTRMPLAPLSLSSKLSWRGDDVLIALKDIFHDKCYLCESKKPTSINIEHLRPHRGDLLRKFDWKNLYFSCGRCNTLKSDKYEEILDCADPAVDVFKSIKLTPPHSPGGKRVGIEPMNAELETLNTISLLEEIYNGDDTINKVVASGNLRENIYKHCNILLPHMKAYYSDESSQEQIDSAISSLKILMHKKQPYSAFLRWIIIDDVKLSEVLAKELDDQ